MGTTKGSLIALAGAAVIATCLFSATANAQSEEAARRAAVLKHWTADRRAAAQPRDLVIDHRGLGYLRRQDGTLSPHGHQIKAENSNVVPNAKPGGGSDSSPPTISNLDPSGITIGDSYLFSATVTDASGVRSVTFVVTYPDGTTTQSFSASNSSGDTWSSTLSGFTNGNWTWHVEATDGSKGRGNRATSDATSFIVDTAGGGGGGGGGGSGDTITNAEWTSGGDVQTAVGRLFYEMPSNPKLRRWAGYVCSGTVVTDGATGRSVILTASHCVYDDANKAFARNVLFIPDQANTTGSGTDGNCANDPIGCWVADFGVVDTNWTTRSFPDNISWDYAFYVVSDSGAHQAGQNNASDVLDSATPAMSIDFTTPSVDDGSAGAGTPDFTYGMGYSYSNDPDFMYCAEDMTTEGDANWWLPSCDLSGGSSGGPWLQPPQGGSGPIISVNSWGYTTSPGMAGPKLNGTSAQCVLDAAIINSFPSNPADGEAGYAVSCP